ncbi:hypothetical protein BKI52_44095 [marine bacterium AO1-C]|nr:hypothetical protein BKI52_44095 [marine bacterium AO1-C]
MISEFNNRYVRYELQETQQTLVQQWFYTGYKNALHLLPHFNEVLDLQKAYQAKHVIFDFRNFAYRIPDDLVYFLRMDFIPRLQSLKLDSIKLINSNDLAIQVQFENLFARCSNLVVQSWQFAQQPSNNRETLLFG